MSKFKQSETLRQFYENILDVLTGDVPGHWFMPDVGLCGNLTIWVSHHFAGQDQYMIGCIRDMLRVELKNQFVAAGLDFSYPFNDRETHFKTDNLYVCPLRFGWIREHADV